VLCTPESGHPLCPLSSRTQMQLARRMPCRAPPYCQALQLAGASGFPRSTTNKPRSCIRSGHTSVHIHYNAARAPSPAAITVDARDHFRSICYCYDTADQRWHEACDRSRIMWNREGRRCCHQPHLRGRCRARDESCPGRRGRPMVASPRACPGGSRGSLRGRATSAKLVQLARLRL
jgi:hypothetical protein